MGKICLCDEEIQGFKFYQYSQNDYQLLLLSTLFIKRLKV